MVNNVIRAYRPVRDAHTARQVKPGDRLPLTGVRADVVSAGGDLVETPLAGGGQATPGCDRAEDHVEDGTENYRSVGLMIEHGAFRFLALGDLSGNTLTRIVCPINRLGPVSAYLVAHHGDYDSNVPALYAALRPRVAVLNNGPAKGGSPDAFRTLHGLAGLEDLWQLHASRVARNAGDDFVANFDNTTDGNWIRLRRAGRRQLHADERAQRLHQGVSGRRRRPASRGAAHDAPSRADRSARRRWRWRRPWPGRGRPPWARKRQRPHRARRRPTPRAARCSRATACRATPRRRRRAAPCPWRSRRSISQTSARTPSSGNAWC